MIGNSIGRKKFWSLDFWKQSPSICHTLLTWLRHCGVPSERCNQTHEAQVANQNPYTIWFIMERKQFWLKMCLQSNTSLHSRLYCLSYSIILGQKMKTSYFIWNLKSISIQKYEMTSFCNLSLYSIPGANFISLIFSPFCHGHKGNNKKAGPVGL